MCQFLCQNEPLIYLNAAGTSWPKPTAVLEEMMGVSQAPPEQAAARLDKATAAVCQALGIPRRDRFLFTPGGTLALALAIGDLEFEPGDVVLTSALEHHALARPVEKLVRERGVVHEVAGTSDAEPVHLERVAARLARGDVKLLAFTTASNVTGARLPVRELTELARRHGVLSLLDAAQTVGLDPTPLPELGADIVTFTGHKAAHGPHGIGGLWAKEHVRFASPQAVCELGGGRSDCSPFPSYCDVGSVNLAGAAGLAQGLIWAHARERQRRWTHAIELAEALAREVCKRPQVTLCGSVNAKRIAIVSMRLPLARLERAERHFAERGLFVRAGQHCAPMALAALGAPEGTLRASFGPGNRTADLDAFLDALDALL